MQSEQLTKLLLQSLEHERGSIDIYQAALKCALRDDLKGEWTRHLSRARNRELLLTEICRRLSINPELMTCGREVNKYRGESFVSAIELAHECSTPQEAQLIACECVSLAEHTSHLNWQLLEKCARSSTDGQEHVVPAPIDEVRDEVDEHFYRAQGWERELWLQSLELAAALPPPEPREGIAAAIKGTRWEYGRDSLGDRPSGRATGGYTGTR